MLDDLEAFLAPRVRAGDLLLIAFSGGADSTALLAGAAELAGRLGVRVTAAHLDHGLDAGSTERAEHAGRLAERLRVPLLRRRREVAGLRRGGESLEEAARRVRYAFLEETRADRGGRWILTAHHRDDQAETLVLRLRQGSGIAGMVGVRAEAGMVLRPLLGLTRARLEAECRRRGLATNDDPANRDERAMRSFVRHRLLPALSRSPGEENDLGERLAAVAVAAAGALPAIDRRLAAALSPVVEPGRVVVARSRLAALPVALRQPALAFLGRQAGAANSVSTSGQEEFWRQFEAGRAIGCDGGSGWRWTSLGASVVLGRAPGPTPPFTYTFAVPGCCDVPEIGCRVSLRAAPVEPWMRRGDLRRAGLAAILPAGSRIEVRNRRPGDRVHPLGAPGERKLKDVLIDRRVPRADRDRLPLLCIDGRIAWVPGITVDERHRLPAEGEVWVAQLEEL